MNLETYIPYFQKDHLITKKPKDVYIFDGCGDFVLIRSLPISYLHVEHIVKKMEKTHKMFADVTSILKLNI